MHDADDGRLAASLAARAGSLLVELRATEAEGRSPAEVGRIGDQRSNDLIVAALNEARPADAVLSEESADDRTRLEADRVWIVDPLDGTREYAMPGRDDWAVHVALWERHAASGGQPGITAAAVALPATGGLHSTREPGAGYDRSAVGGPARVVVSDSRPPVWLQALDEAFPLKASPLGSAGVKAMAVVRGDFDAYLHTGGQYEWDSAAPIGVALAAGLHASRLDGSPLAYNRPDPYLPDLLVCRAELAEPILAALSKIGVIDR